MRPTESRKEVAAKKAALRASLPDLFKRASSDPKAAEEALRACAILRQKPPTLLLTQENIFRTLSPVEISKSLGLLAKSRDSVSLSTVLTALRMKQLGDRTTAVQVGRAFNSNVAKILRQNTKAKESSKQVKEKPAVVVTESTVADAASVVLWILIRLFELPDPKGRSVLPLAAKLIQSLGEIWRHSNRAETAELAVGFFHSLRKNLKRSVYSDLEDDIEVSEFIRDANSELVDWARFVLLDGRLKDLQTAVRIAEDGERTKMLSELQETCRTRQSQLLPQLVEWVAQEVEQGKRIRKPLIAADQSQSSDLNYVAVSLLNAWDAAPEGDRAARTLASVERLARELFNVEFASTVGEVVRYDEGQHEITPSGTVATTSVEVVRPGVRWSDGTRTRALVRTLVRPID